MARFLCLTPTEREIKCVLNGHNLDTHEFPSDLKMRLLRVYNAFPMPPDEFALHDLDEPIKHPAIGATMEPAVFDQFNAYYAALHDMTDPRRNLDDRLRGNYGRFSTMALKLALILRLWIGRTGDCQTRRASQRHIGRGGSCSLRNTARRCIDCSMS